MACNTVLFLVRIHVYQASATALLYNILTPGPKLVEQLLSGICLSWWQREENMENHTQALKVSPESNTCHFHHTSLSTPVLCSLLSLVEQRCIKLPQGGAQQAEEAKYLLRVLQTTLTPKVNSFQNAKHMFCCTADCFHVIILS